MRKCFNCLKEKSIEEFSLRDKKKNIRHKRCRPCFNLLTAKHYKDNSQYYKDKAKRYHKQVTERNHKFICEYLSIHPCIDCGEKDIVVLEFDHQRDKDRAISAVLVNFSMRRLIDEVNKCEVRCANCHKRKTAKEFGYYRVKYTPVT